MKTTLEMPVKKIESEAEDHAQETRYAVYHRGRELHPERRQADTSRKDTDHPDDPWQID